TSSMPWNDEKLNGIRKWLDRVYRLYTETDKLGIEIIKKEKETNKELIYQYNLFVKKVTDNLENQQFNIAISNMMVFINEVYKIKQFNNEFMSNFLIVLSTFAPHISEELYSEFKENKNDSIFDAQWPQYNEELLVLETVNIPIMIKNKPRDVIQVPVDTDENTLKNLVLANPKVLNFIGDNEIKKIIIIKNKTVNIVI
ncbi:MAG: class I tRNA ligase family protein, partial [Ureaplasma sp.]|nr:class I tRNA ligase family protein [Ureaplasma sp.]